MAQRSPYPEADGTVSPNGDVIMPGAELRGLKLVPGQHVRVQVIAAKPRRNMRGLLAGKLPELTEEDFRAVRAGMWRDFPGTQAG